MVSTITTDTDLDEEPVSLVRVPPSPTLPAAQPPKISSFTTRSSSISLGRTRRSSNHVALNGHTSTIPTPKSTVSDASSPRADSGAEPRAVPQITDNCMSCTPETAPVGENLEWIQCNGCKRWSHTLCTELPINTDIGMIDKFHCKRCEKSRGPTTFRPPPRKSERSHVNIDYTSLNLGDTTNILPDQHAYNVFFEGDMPRKFAQDRFLRMDGHELTKEWAERTGCNEPVVVPKGRSEGLGMVMPKDLTVKKVAELVGEDTKVEVIDVPTQKEAPNWRLKQWADYYDTPADERDRVRNVISLEVSSSALGAQVVRPQFVRDLDLIEKVWPSHLRPTSTSSANPSHAPVLLPTTSNTPSNIAFPKVTLYCLMSVARSYTDFHVDFGGSSVFYHILRGNKTFLFIEPNVTNLRKYEAWCSDSEQGRRFLGEEVKECVRVDLSAGDTMIIPSGWIHAVFTPTDSLVLGGNFLTPLHIPSQLNIASIETRTRVPKKFRFPFFDMAMWYTAQYYLDTYIPKRKRGPPPKAGRRNTEGMSEYEVAGLKILADWLWKKAKLRVQQVQKGAEFHRAKVEVPPGIDVVDVASRFAKWVYGGEGEVEGVVRELPSWYRNEILLMKVEGSKKRKRVEGEGEGDGTPSSVRRNVRRNAPKREGEEIEKREGGKKRQIVASTSSSSNLDYAMSNYSNGTANPFSVSLDARFAAFLTPQTITAPGQSFQVHKPYSYTASKTHFSTPGQSFINLILSTCRPYYRPPPLMVHEEIKVEDEPLGGLDALSRAVELATAPLSLLPEAALQTPLQVRQSPDAEVYYPPSSSGSTLTVYSMSPDTRPLRLPTPPSQSPPPSFEDITPLRKKKGPARATADEAEARRLQNLMTGDELEDFRKKRRRGSNYVFGVASLKKELTRLGRAY